MLDDVRLSLGGEVLLDGLSLVLPEAGVTALMGPNGAGKSLTLRVMAGLVAPDRGQVWLAGNALGDAPGAREAALVFQRPVMLRRSVMGNLLHALSVLGVPRARRAERAAALLEMGGLQDLAARPARKLSGGEQQRLALVRALAGAPRLLLLDEPTASLDPQSTAAIEALIRRASEAGAKVVLVTHDRDQAKRLADDVVFLHRGRVAETAPAGEFFQAPQSAEARAYLAGELLV